MIAMNRNIKVYIPAGFPDTAEALALSFVQHCGGVTVQDALGGWLSADGAPCHESVEIISAWYKPAAEDAVHAAVALAVVSLLDQGEEAVLVEEVYKDRCTANVVGRADYDELKKLAGLE